MKLWLAQPQAGRISRKGKQIVVLGVGAELTNVVY